MALIRISRGVPRYNIQIGPQKDALRYNPSAILSVTDDFDDTLMQVPLSKWIPINEIGRSWGYMPFFATKKVLDFWCLEMQYPLVYLCCTAGKHRSPMTAFCWLLSLGGTPESVADEFFGDFQCDGKGILYTYKNDVAKGYLPPDLPDFYQAMKENPGASYRNILLGMLKYELVTYSEDRKVLIF